MSEPADQEVKEAMEEVAAIARAVLDALDGATLKSSAVACNRVAAYLTALLVHVGAPEAELLEQLPSAFMWNYRMYKAELDGQAQPPSTLQ